ncbi:MAG: ATP-binding protein, partial [Bacteroidales bacterium]|nr:ATP-binding protein [Bacteroidales bacterium]
EQSDDLTMLAIQLNNYMDNSKTSDSTRRITLPNDVNAVPQLAAFIEEVAESHGADPSVTMNIDLALEEAVVNVMNYAYPEGNFGEVDVTACFCNGTLVFTVSDSGIPFDPTKVSDPDTSLSAEERPIGGLGIHLVRQLMDEVAYCYENNHNILTLKKKIK